MEKLDNKYIVKEYKKGRSQLDIANELGTYNTSIRRILIRNNIRIKSNGELQRFVNYNPFKEEENQYWLGLFAADGCITENKIVLGLKEEDLYLLNKYRVLFKSEKLKIQKYFNKKYKIYEYSVRFGNSDIVTYLCSLGIVPRKSLKFVYEGEITWDFVRGYFDGDGSIGIYGTNQARISFVCGSRIFLIQLKAFFDKFYINSYIYDYKNKNKSSLVISKQQHVYWIYYYMYLNSGQDYLIRKRNKFETWIESREKLIKNWAASMET